MAGNIKNKWVRVVSKYTEVHFLQHNYWFRMGNSAGIRRRNDSTKGSEDGVVGSRSESFNGKNTELFRPQS